MTTHEDRARSILDQAAADNAERPIGITKHQIRRIAEALAQRERLVDAVRGWMSESDSPAPCLSMRRRWVAQMREVLTDIDKEQV